MGFRISLRELLVLVSLLAAACAVLKFASPLLAGIAMSIALLVCGASAITAFVDRGPRQAFAIGFTVVAAGLTYVTSTYDDGSRYNVSPTEQVLVFLYRHMATRWVFDTSTGERLRPAQQLSIDASGSDPSAPRSEFMDEDDLFGSASLPFGAPPSTTDIAYFPNVGHFIAVGYSIFTLLFAYLGGKLAMWIYHRRVARESTRLAVEPHFRESERGE